MIKRLFRRSSFTVQRPADLGRLAWRVMLYWKVPRIELAIDGFPLLEAQRSQLRLRHLHEVLERKTGGLVAIAVLTVGLADMVRTWNRSMEHMGLVLGIALLAGLAGRLLGRAFVRLRFLFELLRLRLRIARLKARGGMGHAAATGTAAAASMSAAAMPASAVTGTAAAMPAAPSSQPGQSPAIPPREPVGQALRGSCACGAVTFTLSRRPNLMGTCHCAHCRKVGASPFVLVRRSDFALVSGAAAITSREPDAADHRDRSFCSQCGTTLGEMKSGGEEFPIAAHLLDDDLATSNRFHEFVSQKPAWQVICDGARQFAQQRPA